MKFDTESLGWLQDLEPVDGWDSISLLEASEFVNTLENEGYSDAEIEPILSSWNALLEFMSLVEDAQINEVSDSILTTYATNGVIERIQGPTVYRGEEGLVMRLGDNLYSAAIEKEKLVVGKLRGSIAITSVTSGNGQQVVTDDGFDVLSAVASLRIPKGKDFYEVGLSLDLKQDLTRNQLIAVIEDGEPIQPFLRPLPSGGGFTDMRLLPVGEYLCTAIQYEGRHEEYGNSWRLTLDGVGPVMSRGKRIEAALGGDTATESSGKWLHLAAAAKKGGITFNLSKHDVKVQDRIVSYLEWATTPALFADDDANHYLDGGFFTRRKPNSARLPQPSMVEAMLKRALPSSNGSVTATEPLKSAQVQELQQPALSLASGTVADIPF